MFGRIFGRDKDDQDQAVCAECGRTLLAGEWTQTIVGADGEERVICSLCGQSRDFGDEAPAAVATPANNGRVRETRSGTPRDSHDESDAFWKALKEKDAEIEQLQAAARPLGGREAGARRPAGAHGRVGRRRLVRARRRLDGRVRPPRPRRSAAGPVVNELTGDSSEPGERTWGETPAEFAAELAALREETAPVQAAADEADAASDQDEAARPDRPDRTARHPPGRTPPSRPTRPRPPASRSTRAAGAHDDAGAGARRPDAPAVVFEDTQEISAEEAADRVLASPARSATRETTLAPRGSPACRARRLPAAEPSRG